MTTSRSKSTAEESPEPSSKGSRWLKWLAFIVVAIGLTPSLLTVSAKHGAILKFFSPQLESAVSYKTVSTHWWAPIEIVDVTVQDLSLGNVDSSAQQIPLASVASIVSVQPLWRIVLSGGRGAEFVIRQPVLNVSVHDGRTNVETTMERLFANSGGSSGGKSAISATIEDGTIRLLENSVTSNPNTEIPYTTITGIYATLSTLDQSLLFPEITLVANVRQLSLAQQQQQVAARKQRAPQIAATLDELSSDFPLVPFTTDQLSTLSDSESEPDLKIHLGPSTEDKMQQVTVEARRLQMPQLQVLLQRWFPETFFRGELSCRLQGHVIGDNIAQGLAGRFQLMGENIAWRNSTWAVGESVSLGALTAQGAVALAEDGVLVKDLRIKSDVMELSGDGEVRQLQQDPTQVMQQVASGRSAEERSVVAEAQAATAGQVRISGSVDVAAISRMIPRTMNLDQGVVVKSATLRFSTKVQNQVPAADDVLSLSAPKNRFRWQFAAQTSPVQAMRDGQSLNVDSACRLDAVGKLDMQGGTVDAVSLQGAFGKVTAEPLDAGYEISGTINPESIWNDFRDLLNVQRPGLRGTVEFFTRVEAAKDGFQLSRINLKSEGLEANSPLLNIYPARSALQMCEGTLDIRGDSSAIKMLIAPWHTASWLSDSSTITARLEADPRQKITLNAIVLARNPVRPASLYKTISNTSAESSYLVIDQAKIDASLLADQRTGDFLVEKCLLELPGVQANLTGTMGVRQGLLNVNLTADTSYDLDQLSLRVLDPDGRISLSGRGRETFVLSGAPALWTDNDLIQHQRTWTPSNQANAQQDAVSILQANGKLTWTAGRLYGTPVGPGTVVAELRNGLLRAEPIQCTVGSGELSVMPQWNLDSNLLQLASGSRLSNLALTPELCREWLGYVAPMLADSANVDGTISARVHQFQYFIDSPASSTIQAVLTIHRGSATPGSSLQPLLQALSVVGKGDYANRQLEFPPQDVPVQLVDGMVVHDGLEMSLAGYNVRSAGGVGLDRRVQLALDIPLEKAASAASGRSIRIPVGGTVDRPQLDTAGLLQNLGRQQIEGKVNDQINNGLKKLLNKF
ncbi:MAG: hypothetical protein WAO83_20395 [Fuerstiella sp.]